MRHTPFHLPSQHLHYAGELPTDKASIDDNPLPYYTTMLEAPDTEMGRIFSSMSKVNRDNTIVMFLGDNGSPTPSSWPPL